MKKIYLTLIFTIQLIGTVFSQQNFQRIYLFDELAAIINDIYPTDSCYYFGAVTGNSNFLDIVFGKLDLDGNVDYYHTDVTPTEINQAQGGLTQLDTNFRGNFMFGYTNRITGLGWTPQISEVDIDGNVVSDITLDLFNNDSLVFFDYGKVMVSNSDSSYFIYFSYNDRTTDDDPAVGVSGESGVLFAKIKWTGDTLWTKRFYHPQNSYSRPYYVVSDFNPYGTNQFLLSLTERQAYSSWAEDLTWSKIHFIIVDSNGNSLNHFTFQDTQDTYACFGNLVLDDGSVIHSYFDSQLYGTAPNDYFKYRTAISRLNSSFQQEWKDTLISRWANPAFSSAPMRLKLVNDTIFAGSYSWLKWLMYDSSVSNSARAFHTVRIFNRNINGTIIWNRDYTYWALTDSIMEPDYEMWDFELTSDGGFITCGNVKNFDLLNTGGSGQFGYVLKTNCLGYLGDPQAQFSYTIQDSTVTLINESIQAGSYTWVLGNGDTIVTNENIDTLVYEYSSVGIYDIQLIAEGCNSANDTIVYSIELKDNNSGTVGDGTFLTLFPNPVAQGESIAFYVGPVAEGNYQITITNEIGEIVFNGSITSGGQTYILPNQFASGVYFVSLLEGEKRLEVEKLIVN